MPPKIHVIIIDYFKASRVIDAVRSIRAQDQDQSSIAITILDNSCCDKNYSTLKKIPSLDAEIIKSETNIGYVAAVNLAARQYNNGADLILLLNPDIIISEKSTISSLAKNFDAADCYIVGPAQINDDGSTPSTVRGYPSLFALIAKRTALINTKWGSRLVSKYLLQGFDASQKQSVPWLQSSCVLIRRTYWDAVGGLNPKYFLFMADIEICKKAYELGGKVIYDPTYKAIADGRRCSEGGIISIFKSRTLRIHLIDAIKYYASNT